MPRVIPHFMTGELEGDFVFFLIGMRINKPWKIHKWLPVFLALNLAKRGHVVLQVARASRARRVERASPT